MSRSAYKKICKYGNGDNKNCIITAPLIAQLSKNFTEGLNKLITGDELLKLACDKVSFIQSILGGKLVYLECEDILKLKEFYESNGFFIFDKRFLEKKYGDEAKNGYLLQMFKILKK